MIKLSPLIFVLLFCTCCTSQNVNLGQDNLVLVSPLEAIATSRPASTSPLEGETHIVTYQGANRHEGYPLFQIQYDRNSWEYEEGAPFGFVLTNLQLPGCFLILTGGGYGLEDQAETIQLAGREWEVLPSYGNGYLYRAFPYGFEVFVSDDVLPDAKSRCQKSAEEVLISFKPLSS